MRAGHRRRRSGADARAGVSRRRVHLIAPAIDYSDNTRVLIDELRQRLRAGPGS